VRAWDDDDPRLNLRHRLKELVGWDCRSDDPILGSGEAYNVAFNAIKRAMFPCPRGCSCAAATICRVDVTDLENAIHCQTSIAARPGL
jgi:hypothetical protein